MCLHSGIIIGLLIQCRSEKTSLPSSLSGQSDSTSQTRAIDPIRIVNSAEEATIALFENAAPNVVYITTTTVRQDYWSRNIYEIPTGTGSGFIWDDKGNIVTNYHVIKGAYKAKVTLSDQTTWDAEIADIEPRKDRKCA